MSIKSIQDVAGSESMQQQVSIPYQSLPNWSWSTSTQSTQPGLRLQVNRSVEKSESESEQEEQILVPYDFSDYWTPWGRDRRKCQQSKGHPSEVEGNRSSIHESTVVGASHCQARQESPFNQPSLASNARSNTGVSSNHNNDFGIMMPSAYKSTSSRMGCI